MSLVIFSRNFIINKQLEPFEYLKFSDLQKIVLKLQFKRTFFVILCAFTFLFDHLYKMRLYGHPLL